LKLRLKIAKDEIIEPSSSENYYIKAPIFVDLEYGLETPKKTLTKLDKSTEK